MGEQSKENGENDEQMRLRPRGMRERTCKVVLGDGPLRTKAVGVAWLQALAVYDTIIFLINVQWSFCIAVSKAHVTKELIVVLYRFISSCLDSRVQSFRTPQARVDKHLPSSSYNPSSFLKRFFNGTVSKDHRFCNSDHF